MKKLIFCASALCLLFSSCLKDSVDERTINYTTNNLIIPLKGDEKPIVGVGTYSVNAIVSNGTLSVSANLRLPQRDLAISTGQVRYATNSYSLGNGAIGTVTKFQNASGTASSLPVTGFSGAITSLFYYPNTDISLPGINFTPAAEFGPMTVFGYNIGDEYKVRTFARDAVYSGSTSTHYAYQGQAMPTFTTDKILYRIVMSSDYKTADLIIYQAKFAEQQPVEIAAMVLKGLTVEFNSRGYTITGKDIEPQVPELNGAEMGYTTYDNYTFYNVVFQTVSDDLTTASIDYTVENPRGGNYTGQFTGRYCLIDPKSDK